MTANEHSTVVLSFWSEHLSPDEMTKLAGIAPDATAEKGTAPWGGAFVRDRHRWDVKSGLDPDSDTDAHLADVFSRVQANLSGLVKLRDAADECGLSVAIHDSDNEDSSPGFHLEEAWVGLLAALSASFDAEVFVDRHQTK